MIFVDSNIPMYIVGQQHLNKTAARAALESAVLDGEGLVTDAEVYQEILHRYIAIGRREAIQSAYDVLDATIDEVLDIGRADVGSAKDIVLGTQSIPARDALHAAVMRRIGCDRILTFDRDFDLLPGVTRLP